MITDKVGGSSAKPEVSKQSKEKRLKHKVSGYKSQSKRRSIAGCRLLLRTLKEEPQQADMQRKDFNFTVLISIDFPNGLCNSDEFIEKCQEKESKALDEGWSKLVYCLDSFDYH